MASNEIKLRPLSALKSELEIRFIHIYMPSDSFLHSVVAAGRKTIETCLHLNCDPPPKKGFIINKKLKKLVSIFSEE